MFYYIKTGGIPLHLSYNGDETKFWKNFVSSKQLAIKGAKEVPCSTEGRKKMVLAASYTQKAMVCTKTPFLSFQAPLLPIDPSLHKV